MNFNIYRFASPQAFYPLAGKMIPWFWALAAVFGLAGLYVGFLVAPTDAQQGEGYRIIFLHVPVSWMSMFVYLVMAFWAGLGLAFNFRLSGMMAQALAPTGALFTFLSLWTGALWGKPMWGTWWVWDARLTSELILLFLYLGFTALQAAIDGPDHRSDRATVDGGSVGLAEQILAPLVRASLENVLASGRNALTGPVARGDLPTVQRHIAALDQLPDPGVAQGYRAMAARAAAQHGNPDFLELKVSR